MSYTSAIGSMQQNVSVLSPQPKTVVPTASVNDGSTSASNRVESVADQTVLSTGSGLLSLGLSSSDIRTSKVEALQRQIADGSYSVPAASVADKMIQTLVRQ